ncbi:uncharacterized protein LOC126886336 [Diabrotica virgifera virgifera]|uniref:MADF domain-containing protein n=1 Tax=Diabrotica virgifera virgifera TaxID=50390 RepID=A0ABM5KG36_DIAVI|nr:uncharacterized protein LOC126886336 [Diabrotica virgifera virgifera]
MPFMWTHELVLELIENYKLCECLWNTKHAQYKCRNAKHDAWTTLAEKTGSNIEEVKRKMKNVIAQFYRERKKYRTLKKSGTGAVFISKWFAYEVLLFLAGRNKVRKCTEKGITTSEGEDDGSDSSATDSGEVESQDSNIADEADAVTDSSFIVGEANNDVDTLNKTVAAITETPTKPNENRTRSPTPSTSSTTKSKQGPRLFKSPKTMKKRQADVTTDERQEEAYVLLKQLQNKKPRNRFQIFGELVACKIENLQNENAKNTVEHLISNILYDASMGKYDRPFPCYQSWHTPSANNNTARYYSDNQNYYSSSTNDSVTSPASTTHTPMPSPNSSCYETNYLPQTETNNSTLSKEKQPCRNLQESSISDAIRLAMSDAGLDVNY